MVKCNSCPASGLHFVGNILYEPDGEKHECLKGKRKAEGKPYMDQGLAYVWIEDGDEPNPNIPREVRLEGNTWTQYQYGKRFKVKPIKGTKK